MPLILAGPGIRPGRYVNRVEIVDLAPTLAVLLELDAPTGLEGTVRFEALQR